MHFWIPSIRRYKRTAVQRQKRKRRATKCKLHRGNIGCSASHQNWAGHVGTNDYVHRKMCSHRWTHTDCIHIAEISVPIWRVRQCVHPREGCGAAYRCVSCRSAQTASRTAEMSKMHKPSIQGDGCLIEMSNIWSPVNPKVPKNICLFRANKCSAFQHPRPFLRLPPIDENTHPKILIFV